ncbi:MAG: acetate kinase [Clostridiales bacterium]|jgi:acetate kinase|nr:acetate kinase [Clostridiales bacterium]
MIIMVINSGSSSLKYKLFDMRRKLALAKGACERIGIDGVMKYQTHTGLKKETQLPLPDHKAALTAAIAQVTDSAYGVVRNINEIGAIGHRVGHGGVYFSDSTLIDDAVIMGIRKCIPLAPLHNPAALMGIEACRAVFCAGTPQVAVCDTAFHQTLPPRAYTYSLPRALCKKHGIRRYGFHGTSHKYVGQQAARLLGKPFEECNIISCHLGNGSSITAIERGKSIDNTMGITSLQGVVMGTRCGDIDPALPTFLMREEGMSADEVDRVLYTETGLLGLSGVSPDLRDIEISAAQGDADAQNAIDTLVYQVKKYIGAYLAVLGYADAIVFTAGIGENSAMIRLRTLGGLERLGILLDEEKNNAYAGQAADIAAAASAVRVYIIPTDEEWMIACDTERLTAGS